jgi:pyruvate/2-oxoglutarate dehydrogenase complex dihydrolipoamide acyltransferase (E2) component
MTPPHPHLAAADRVVCGRGPGGRRGGLAGVGEAELTGAVGEATEAAAAAGRRAWEAKAEVDQWVSAGTGRRAAATARHVPRRSARQDQERREPQTETPRPAPAAARDERPTKQRGIFYFCSFIQSSELFMRGATHGGLASSRHL